MKQLKPTILAASVLFGLALPALAATLPAVPGGGKEGFELTPNVVFPAFDAALGRKVFAEKGCVVCHSINGIGGTDGPNLSWGKYDTPINAMEVATDLWAKASTMIAMQKNELGKQIILSPDELAGLIAFLGDPKEQAKLKMSDIPDNIRKDMEE